MDKPRSNCFHKLVSAVLNGNVNEARAHLQNIHCNVTALDSDGATVLMLATHRVERGADRAQIMKDLLAHDRIDVNKPDFHGWTALHHAACIPSSSIAVKMLINCRQCDVNVQDSLGDTALSVAAEMVQSDVDVYGNTIKLLLTRDDIDAELINTNDETPLQRLLRPASSCKASIFDCNSLYQTILSLINRSNPDAKCNRNTLAKAVSYNSIGVCESLLKRGFSSNDAMKPSSVWIEAYALFGSSEGRETALHRAVRLDSLLKTKLLLDHNADCGNKWRGLTPLELAIAYNVRPEISALLSKDKSKSEIAEAIEKCSMVGESVQECVMRLDVPVWRGLLDDGDISNSSLKCFSGTADFQLIVDTPSPARSYGCQLTLHAVVCCRYNFRLTESKLVEREIVSFLRNISDIVADRVPGLQFEPILAGSMAEGTKVYLPNEVDVMCVLERDFAVRRGGIGHLMIVCSSALPESLSDKHKVVKPSRLAVLFYSAVEFALDKMVKSTKRAGKLRLFKRSLIWCDKVSRLQLMWNGEKFKNMTISVDLAVCARVDMATAKLVDNNIVRYCNISKYFVIGKSAKNERASYPNLSTSNFEKEILDCLPINVKRGLILAKAVRIASIAKPDEDLSTAFCLAENVYIDDLISSHLLKSCLIQSQLPSIDSPCHVAIKIYTNLQMQLKKKRVDSWTDNDPFLDCTECTAKRSCCMKKKLMLTMTRKILLWLQDNEAQLQVIDYADEVDHCDIKALVYRRHDVPESCWLFWSTDSI